MTIDTNTSTVLVALLVSVIAPAILAFFSSMSRRQERRDALEAKREDWKRQDEVARQAQQVALTLTQTNAHTDQKLASLQRTADGTHTIVNNQRTVLLRINAELRDRIAHENPDDAEAQAAAQEAHELLRLAEAAQINGA